MRNGKRKKQQHKRKTDFIEQWDAGSSQMNIIAR